MLKKILFSLSLSLKIIKIRIFRKHPVFLMATPCHGNLGDHAIVYAQYQILADNGYAKQIVEIKNTDYLRYKHIIKKKVAVRDMIIIDGGGSLGTLWPHENDKINEIINTFINNKIIIFPQTCFYSKDFKEKERLENTKKIYYKHKDLTIALRDKQSYDFFCENFPLVKILYVPDVVLYIDKSSIEFNRKGVLLCFRKDLEKIISDTEKNKIKFFLKSKDILYFEKDTVINKKVTKRNRNKELQIKWDEFSTSSLVITDRLHAMIFAAITGTPCIALNNRSRKVSGVYNWIPLLCYIKFCSEINEVEDEIINLYEKNSKYDRDILKNDFNKLSIILRNEK